MNIDKWNLQEYLIEKSNMKSEYGLGGGTDIMEGHNDIFLSTTMTGNLQLVRMEQIGYFRYNSKSKQWEAILYNHHTLMLKKNTNSQKILSYHPDLIQINQAFIINIAYLGLIKDNNCILFPPFDRVENLSISKSFMKKLKDKFLSI